MEAATPGLPRVLLHLGLYLAALALVGQVALGGLVLPDTRVAAASAAFDAVAVICAGHPPAGHDLPHHPPAPHQALCPLTASLAPAVILASASALPPPTALAGVAATDTPPQRGPPPRTARVGAPRAPPVPA